MTQRKKSARKRPQRSRKKASSRSTKEPKNDIVSLILEDHKPLKRLIKVLKNSKKDIGERRAAFDEFAPLLLEHARSEADVLYSFLLENEKLREEAYEGNVEHDLAELTLNEARQTDDEDLFSARIKVLAELVEHHIEEEEEDLLPKFKKHSKQEERTQLGEDFLAQKHEVERRAS